MTKHPTNTAATLLAGAGVKPEVVSAVEQLDALMQTWRRRAAKREIGIRALEDLGLPIDLAQLDVLTAIEAPAHEFGETGSEETMVSTVAARLSIDPSRASRLIAEMVERGYVLRVASQADSRRTLIQLTPTGSRITEAVRAYKFLLLGDYLAEWRAEDLAAFLPLLQRFSQWSEDVEARREKFIPQIAELAARIADPASARELATEDH
jgi:DNA-binding MarR family transcriptional regulator